MRVLQLSGWYPPDSIGGTETYVDALARDLAERGHEVAVAAPTDGPARTYEHAGLTVHRYRIAAHPDRRELRGETLPAHFEEFEALLERLEPEVVHLHSLTRGLGLRHARAARTRGAALVLTLHVPGVTCERGTMRRLGRHTCDGEMRRRRCATCVLQKRGMGITGAGIVGSLPRTLGRLLSHLPGRVGTALGTSEATGGWIDRSRELLALVDRVVSVSAWLDEVAARNGVEPQRRVLSRHGLRDAPEAPSPARRPGDGPLRVGFLGRMDPVKGIDVLVEAVRRVEPPIELTIHAPTLGPSEEAFRDRLSALAAGDPRIRFDGAVPPERRYEILAGLDLLAVPSTWLEAGPLVVLEAFAVGRPVLGSDLGGIAERVTSGRDGRLVPVGDVAAWAAALTDLAGEWQAGDWKFDPRRPRKSDEVAAEMESIYLALTGEDV